MTVMYLMHSKLCNHAKGNAVIIIIELQNFVLIAH